ncbi:MAG: hypothetical protein PHC88_04990 [Terrimicrobiaceae bacterium]|nr:hypothetical protein [Terrimicrobiaceae bacterium]
MKLPIAIGAAFLALHLASGLESGSAPGSTARPSPNPSSGPITRGQRVFSTGHSYHFAFPALLTEITQSAGIADSSIVGISSLGGSRVIQHWANQAAQEALTAGAVDVLTATPIYLPDEGVEKFAQLGLAHNPNFRLLMMEFWLPFDQYEPRNYSHGPAGSPTEFLAPPAKVDRSVATAAGLRKIHERYFREMDELVVGINKKLARQVVFVVPVGQAVIALREKVIAGKAPGIKTQQEIFSDYLGHPNAPLRVMMAYAYYAVIYRKSPVGLPVPKELGPGPDAKALNRLLQNLAWQAVIQNPLSGVTAH